MSFLCALLAVTAFAAPPLSADDIVWGEPVAGLRVGISCATPTVRSDVQPIFTVVLENTSDVPLTLPALSAYMTRQHDRYEDYCAQPLRPNIETVGGAKPMYSQYGGDDLASISQELVTLNPGETLTLEDLHLEDGYYSADQTNYGDKATRRKWWLLPDSTCQISFTFENEQAEVGGKQVWVGKAISDALTIRVFQSLEGFEIDGRFELAKTAYYVSEPVRVTFHVVNKGEEPISFVVGHDYRGTGRHERFSFVAVDETGNQVPDPIENPMCLGGVGGDVQLKPGETHSEELLINEWCAFSKPGRYTITCKRTLNLRSGRPVPECVLPALPIETKLGITLLPDDEGFDQYLQGLVERLEDPHDDEAYGEMKIIAKAKSEAAFPAVARLACIRDWKQRERVQWLTYYGQQAREALLEVAKTGNATARAVALPALATLDVPDIVPLVQKALSSEHPRERDAAVRICTREKYPECFPILIGMTEDDDDFVRASVCWALGEYNDQRAVPPLLKQLRATDASVTVKGYAARALNKLGHKDGLPVLIELLRSEEGKSQRMWIGWTLRELTGKDFPNEYSAWIEWWNAEGK